MKLRNLTRKTRDKKVPSALAPTLFLIGTALAGLSGIGAPAGIGGVISLALL